MKTRLSFALVQTKYLNTPFTKCNPAANYTKRACLRHQQMKQIVAKVRFKMVTTIQRWCSEQVFETFPSATAIQAMTQIFMRVM